LLLYVGKGSCDRDCKLADWSAWSPCTMACGGGFTARFKKVLVPTRGLGKCLQKRSEKERCNQQPCAGDEVCIARQDLILALDASSSLGQKGYDVVKQFAANLTRRYTTKKYWGKKNVKVGVVLFGNGKLIQLKEGGTRIKPAIKLHDLTFDFETVRTKIAESKWQRGFTNMAQAFITADKILHQRGRPDAQSAVMVISDGKFSFKYQTAEQIAERAQKLKDGHKYNNIQIYMAPIAETEESNLKFLKKWASQPWQTTYERIPGLCALEHNNAFFVQKLIVKFCPDSISPSVRAAKDKARPYILIHENGWPSDECGDWVEIGMTKSKDDCARQARERGMPGFAFGKSDALGECFGHVILVTQSYFYTYEVDPKNPAPACGKTSGCPPRCEWLENPYFNSYAINPSSMGKQKADNS